MRQERSFRRRFGPVGGLDDLADLEPVALGEGEVALVVRGHGHDRARPVLHQHVVGDPDRDSLVVDRIQDVASREHSVLLLRLALDRGPRAGMPYVVQNLCLAIRALHQTSHQRMLRGQHEERRAEERVRTGREDLDLVADVVHPEEHVRAL